MNSDLKIRKAIGMLDAGRAGECEAYLRSSIRESEASGNRYDQGQFLCVLGEILVELGRRAEGEAMLRTVLEIAPDDDVLDLQVRTARELLGMKEPPKEGS